MIKLKAFSILILVAAGLMPSLCHRAIFLTKTTTKTAIIKAPITASKQTKTFPRLVNGRISPNPKVVKVTKLK
jgi:hypothetical protein